MGDTAIPVHNTCIGTRMNSRAAVFCVYLLLSLSLGALCNSQKHSNSWHSLDRLLQDYAFRALRATRIKTGVQYSAVAPANLSGIDLSAIRLRSGSLRRYGVHSYQEFDFPTGVVVSPYFERIVLVYHNLMNWSSVYFDAPGYMLVAPVVGFLAYDASNLNATNLQELHVVATNKPISIHFTSNRSPTYGLTPLCVSFYLNGTVSFTNMSSPNVCNVDTQGHFSLVVNASLVPSPSPAPSPGFPVPPHHFPRGTPPGVTPPGNKKESDNTWKIITGSTVGGVVGLALLAALCIGGIKYRERSHIQRMELRADNSEALQTSVIGGSRAPVAGGTRTQPTLENEYSAA